MENMDEDRVDEILSSFSCAKDPDIESFIHHRAVEFEKLYKARTYLVLDHSYLLIFQVIYIGRFIVQVFSQKFSAIFLREILKPVCGEYLLQKIR